MKAKTRQKQPHQPQELMHRPQRLQRHQSLRHQVRHQQHPRRPLPPLLHQHPQELMHRPKRLQRHLRLRSPVRQPRRLRCPLSRMSRSRIMTDHCSANRIRISDHGKGLSFCGTECHDLLCQRRNSSPLPILFDGFICTMNHFREISKAEALPMLIQQIYRPYDSKAPAKTLSLPG